MSRDQDFNNPAGRLHRLLADFQAEAAGQTMSCATAWSMVFKLESNDSEYLVQLGQVAALYPQALYELQAAGHADHAGNLRTFGQLITKSFRVADPFFVQNDGARQAVDDGAQTVLNLTATLLSSQRPQGLIPGTTDLADISMRIDGLLSDIQDSSDFPPTVKDLLLRRLMDVERAVEEIRFRGPAGIREAGELLLVSSATAAASSKPETKPLLDRINGVVVMATAACALFLQIQTTALDTAANIPKIINAVQGVSAQIEGPQPLPQLEAGQVGEAPEDAGSQ